VRDGRVNEKIAATTQAFWSFERRTRAGRGSIVRCFRSPPVLLCLFAGAAFARPVAAEDGERDRDEGARRNWPPKFTPYAIIEPAMANLSGSPMVLRSGRRTTISLKVEDPDGDALSFTAHRLPRGATFDPIEGVVTWTPTRAQEGKHEIDFEANDGTVTAKQTFTFRVIANRAPEGTNEHVLLFTAIAKPIPDIGMLASNDSQAGTIAADDDGDDLSIVVRKQPPGMRIQAVDASVSYRFSPTEKDVGEHELVVEVSDGELRTTVERKVVVFPEWSRRDYKGWLLLGGGPSAFVTHDDGEFFVGGALDVTFAALREDAESGYRCAHDMRYNDCHASHHRFYAEFEVLDSMREGDRSLFTYGAGYSATFEWSPGRRTFIPHYGIEVGGLVRDDLGHRAQTRPYLGIHVFSNDDVWVNAMLGYRVVPAELYELSGPTFALTLVLNPW
jgi:hypothetical protein